MHAYRTLGGPCHWDIQICLYVFLGPRYARHHIGNFTTPQGQAQVRREARRQVRRLQAQFDDFFNPNKEAGEWQLFEFGPCCSFHIDAEFHVPPAEWAGLTASEIEDRLPEGCGILVVERIRIDEHPHATLSGRRVLVGEDSDRFTLAHELGHLLGLPDQYATPDVPELGIRGNGMTPEEEAVHRGHLMGKKDESGERRIVSHEIQEIARLTGMSCDKSVCCPDRGERGGGTREPSTNKNREPVKTLGIREPEYLGAHAGVVTKFDLAADTLSKRELEDATLEDATGCSAGLREESSAAGDGLAARIAPLLDRFLKERGTAFVPDCEPAEYRTQVYARLLVRDCETITEEEKQDMSDQLIRRGKRSASIICELNPKCQNAVLLGYRFERIVCENRLWEVDLTWVFKCVSG